MTEANKDLCKHVCRVVLTRGQRARMLCGRPVCQHDENMCLNHWRIHCLHRQGTFQTYQWPQPSLPEDVSAPWTPRPDGIYVNPQYQAAAAACKEVTELQGQAIPQEAVTQWKESEFIDYVRKHSPAPAQKVEEAQTVDGQHEKL